MKVWVAVVGVAGVVVAMAGAQVPARSAPATVSACGVMSENFSAKAGPAQGAAAQVPEGKALVYVVEDILPLRNTLRVGMDGKWVGATSSHTYLSFAVDPGVHHLCVTVQGSGRDQLEKGITLRQLHVDAGKTYYLRVRVVWGETTQPLIFLEAVDEDEGQLLVQTMVPTVWKVK